MRSLCGVTSGATKASLSIHFAKNGNVADLNAKEGSQETLVNLAGMLASRLICLMTFLNVDRRGV